MTALKQFERLESSGLWRETPQAQRRDVIVSFGDASLVVSDTQSRALTHWSLAAVTRTNPGVTPAIYSPGPDATETLEIDDQVMIEAIEKIRSAIARRRPHRGRLRLILLGGGLALVLALLLFWIPGAMVRHTVSVVPASVRGEIGQRLLDQIARVSGRPCSTPEGDSALRNLTNAILGPQGGRVVILPAGATQATHLPGQLFLLNRALVEDYEDADVAAGFVLAEDARARQQDPLEALLHHAGLRATFGLLTTGTLPDAPLDAYVETLMTRAPAPLADDTLLARFAKAQVPSSPYAYALDVSGETVLPLIEGDPMRGATRHPVVSDADWVRLQGICGE